MFRALLCSSSGGQIVVVQHLVPSLSLGDRSVHRLREDSRSLCSTFLAFKKRITDRISQSAAPSVVLNMFNAQEQI